MATTAAAAAAAATLQNDVDESSETRNRAKIAIMELANLISIPMCLTLVIRHHIPTIIWSNGANTPLTPSQIINLTFPNNTTANADNLRRILRLLAAYGVFTEHPPLSGETHRRYSLTDIGRTLVPGVEGVSHGDYVLQHHQDAVVQAWLKMDNAVVGPTSITPYEVANGESAFYHYEKSVEMNVLMQRAMAGVSVPFMKAVVNGGYGGFEGVERLVDVGGSGGDCLKMIMNKFDWIKEGINFDLPEVVAKAPQIPGVTHVGGDMFKSIPSGDALFMKWILTNFTDDEVKLTMKNCYEALPTGGKFIACEAALTDNWDDIPRIRALLAADIFNMTVYGGKHRTEKEYQQVGYSVGFKHFRAVHVDYFFTLLEFQK